MWKDRNRISINSSTNKRVKSQIKRSQWKKKEKNLTNGRCSGTLREKKWQKNKTHANAVTQLLSLSPLWSQRKYQTAAWTNFNSLSACNGKEGITLRLRVENWSNPERRTFRLVQKEQEFPKLNWISLFPKTVDESESYLLSTAASASTPEAEIRSRATMPTHEYDTSARKHSRSNMRSIFNKLGGSKCSILGDSVLKSLRPLALVVVKSWAKTKNNTVSAGRIIVRVKI